MIWVKRDDSDAISDNVLRERAGVEDTLVEVETRALGKWNIATIPAGARDESGTVLPIMNVGYSQLPPDGRVFIVAKDDLPST